VFDRYNIFSENDLVDAGRKIAAFQENGDNSGGRRCTKKQQRSCGELID